MSQAPARGRYADGLCRQMFPVISNVWEVSGEAFRPIAAKAYVDPSMMEPLRVTFEDAYVATAASQHSRKPRSATSTNEDSQNRRQFVRRRMSGVLAVPALSMTVSSSSPER